MFQVLSRLLPRRLLPGLAMVACVGGLAAPSAAVFAAVPAVGPYLEDLTWTELRDRVKAGSTTVLVPVGGTEQSGPQIALGKHNRRVQVIAGRIAQRLGNAVVAPTLAYVPEGAIAPPAAHMRFAGTISIPETVFEAVLESAARSFRQHGFRDVVLLGDHGGYQKSLERVAAKLNREWAGQPACRVLALVDYYRVTQTDFVDALKAKGLRNDEIGSHAGLADTALMLAVDPAMVRSDALEQAATAGPRDGVHGDPRRATAELGRLGVERQIERSVQVIRDAARAR
jgi:creatinine amidohydrolase/Fe(II)-dependent formamide hydrolase-like protein